MQDHFYKLHKAKQRCNVKRSLSIRASPDIFIEKKQVGS